MKIIKMKMACLLTCLLVLSAIPLASAQGPFDMTCPTCNGTGWVTCDTCHGEGWVGCSKCEGKGWYYEDQTCQICGGDGKKDARIVRTDSDAEWTLYGADWKLDITGKFYDYDDGTYGTVYAATYRYGTLYDEGRKTVWFSGHSYTTVNFVLDAAYDGADWTYTIYLESSEPITCTTCGGDGVVSVKVNCVACGGRGTVKCDTCGGDGTLTCPRCNGKGYVTNWVAIGGATLAFLVVVGGGAYAYAKRRKPTAPVPTPTPTPAVPEIKPTPPAEGKVHCIHCGAGIPESATVCPVCGRKQE